MRGFSCSNCGNKVHFENVTCLACGHALGFLPDASRIVALVPGAQPGSFRLADAKHKGDVKYCGNFTHGACNWLTAADDTRPLCAACDLNRTIPNLQEPGSLEAWQELEQAKKRLVYSLFRFGLPVDGSPWGKGKLAFDFVRNATTGHLDGVITIDIMEADAVERERQRKAFSELYRSLLGHLRHESGHFYWMLLVEAAGRLQTFRDLFGDERQDYAGALARHHADGPPPDWQSHHVSAYASAHPWEDWAETWAHYLHMVDALETAEAEGMEPRARGISFGSLWPFKTYDIYREETFDALIERWIPLTVALNLMCRSMGQPDFYPFVISAEARSKLAFVHDLVRAGPANPRGRS